VGCVRWGGEAREDGTITLGAIAPYSTPPDDAWGFAATQLRAWLAMEKPEAPTDLASEPALRVEQMCLRALVALSEGHA